MSGRGRLLTAGFVLVAVVVLIVFGLAGTNSTAGGRLAPALPSATLLGPRVTLAELRGRPVFVTFWASWCTECEREAATLERFSLNLRGRARLIGVDSSDVSLGDARSFISRYRWTFPNLQDPDGVVGNRYGLGAGLPTTFLIDSQGRIRQTLRGPQTEQTLDRALSQLASS
jgi:cytochrome c biogenesis protein CcmG/thiol:disulfide interchange protein DsbE